MPKSNFNILKQVQDDLEFRANDGNIKMINLDQIDYNENNSFSMDPKRVQALADEIMVNGFRSVVEVREMKNGRYQLIAGETRTRAMHIVYENTKDPKYKAIPCYVSTLTDLEAEERLITDELLKRTHTPYEKLMAVEKLERIYSQKKKSEKLPGRIQFMIAEATGIKKSQVGNYQKIIKKAVPKVKELIKKGEISIDSAKEISSLKPSDQIEFLSSNSKNYSKEIIDKYMKAKNCSDTSTIMHENSVDNQKQNHHRNISNIIDDLAINVNELEDRLKMIEFSEEYQQLLMIKSDFPKLFESLNYQPKNFK